ncbi:MAG: hypothetical protein IPO86_01650 [Saprospiraceae bacterium]|nr:hypothetical protein [Saprospiraceae bacterium]
MRFLLILVFGHIASTAFLQAVYFNPDQNQKFQLDRLEIQSGRLFANHLQNIPLDQGNCMHTLLKLKFESTSDDSVILNKLILDNVENLYTNDQEKSMELRNSFRKKPILKYFYKDGSHWLSVYKKSFQLQLDPILDLKFGKEEHNSELLFTNRRGLRFQGTVDQIISFHADVIETQLTTPLYVEDYIKLYKSFPGAGLFKSFKSKLFTLNRAYDFLISEASISVRIAKHVSLSLGHGRHFIGSGIRSLLLSDFATPHFYLKFNTNVWRLHYQNIFAELSPESLGDEGNRLLPKKYMATHYLSMNLTKNWNVGLFESVVFSRAKGFELQYLNPVILYRFIEHALGSPDNVLLGFHSNLLLAKRISVYGQLMIDEFLLKEFVKQNGWWGNKYGIQAGIKYVNAFNIRNLDFQAEFNLVRPYTYTFRDSISNYTHFFQALAHPLGANFKEFIFRLHYVPHPRYQLTGQCLIYQKGLDSSGINNGGNILLNYNTRNTDFNHTIGQGIQNQVIGLSLNFSYQLFQRAWLDFNVHYRKNEIEKISNASVWFSGGFRMTIDKMNFDF